MIPLEVLSGSAVPLANTPSQDPVSERSMRYDFAATMAPAGTARGTSTTQGVSGIGDGSMAALRHAIASSPQEARTHAHGADGVLELGLIAEASNRFSLREATVGGRSFFSPCSIRCWPNCSGPALFTLMCALFQYSLVLRQTGQLSRIG